MGSVVDFHKPDCLPWQDTPLSSEDTIGMFPNDFYLAHTAERFDCSAPLEINGRETYFIPMLEGRSTVARCGLSVHSSAGYGDVGFSSSWTLELTTALPIILRPGDRIAQVFFIEASSGTVKYDGAYTDQHDGPRAPVLGKERFR
jgi:dCTP deaminase